MNTQKSNKRDSIGFGLRSFIILIGSILERCLSTWLISLIRDVQLVDMYSDASYSLNPIGDMELPPFDNRMEPVNINFVKMKLFPSPRDFEGRSIHTKITK